MADRRRRDRARSGRACAGRRHRRAGAACPRSAGCSPPSVQVMVHGCRMMRPMSSSAMLNETSPASPRSSSVRAYSSGARPALAARSESRLPSIEVSGAYSATRKVSAPPRRARFGLHLVAHLAAQLAGDAPLHHLAAAHLRPARHQGADDAGAARLVGILIGEHLHAARARRLDVRDERLRQPPARRPERLHVGDDADEAAPARRSSITSSTAATTPTL